MPRCLLDTRKEKKKKKDGSDIIVSKLFNLRSCQSIQPSFIKNKIVCEQRLMLNSHESPAMEAFDSQACRLSQTHILCLKTFWKWPLARGISGTHRNQNQMKDVNSNTSSTERVILG